MAAFIKMAELGSFDKNVGIEQNKNPSSGGNGQDGPEGSKARLMNINCMKVPEKLNTNTNINTISNANKKTNANSGAKLYIL